MEKKGLKVVLADNNVQDRETRTKAIEEAGMQVVFSTGDGKKALDAIYREQPDIVVMDMILPGLDGIGILEEIEKVDMLPQTGNDDRNSTESVTNGFKSTAERGRLLYDETNLQQGIWRTFAANCRGNEGKQHKTR